MKAQIKMGETVAIMVIFFFLLIFGFSFYAGVQQKYYRDEVEKQMNLKVLQITQKASYLPELQCSNNDIQHDNCFDVQKAEIFFNLVKDDPELISRYYDIFSFSTLFIKEIYPGSETIYIYNQSIPNSTDMTMSMVPISLFDGQDNTYSIGVLYINYSITQR